MHNSNLQCVVVSGSCVSAVVVVGVVLGVVTGSTVDSELSVNTT